MKVYKPQPVSDQVIQSLQQQFESGASQSHFIAAIRTLGLDVIDCIKLISSFYKVSLGEAKEIVHSSDAWADMRQTHDAFHESAWEAAQQSGYVESEVPPHAQPKTHSAA